MAINTSVGGKLRQLRQKQGMTLKQVSEKVGLSQGFLSQVENGRATLGMNALLNVAELFNVDVSAFFGRTKEDETARVIRSYDRHNLQVSSEFVEYSLSNEACNKDLAIYIFEIYPTKEEENDGPPVIFNHASSEFLYVLEGVLTEIVEGVETVLNPGDCIHIPPNADHAWANNTGKIVKALVVHKYDSFSSGKQS